MQRGSCPRWAFGGSATGNNNDQGRAVVKVKRNFGSKLGNMVVINVSQLISPNITIYKCNLT